MNLGLTVEVSSAGGGNVARWDSNASTPEDRPSGVSFRTKRGDGFADASLSLPRRIDGEYVDLGLLRDLKIVGEDGSVAYEGRVTNLPRSMSAQHTIDVQAAGWMSHAKDRKFREVYVDRDLARWGDPSVPQQIRLLGFSYTPSGPSTAPDPTGGQAALLTRIEGKWAVNAIPRVQAWYDSGGIPLAKVYYSWRQANANATGFDWKVGLSTDAEQTSIDQTGDLEAAGPSSGTFTTSTPAGFAYLDFYFATNAAAGGDGAQFTVFWTTLAVYGAHGLPVRGTGPGGFYVSDLIRNIANRWAPLLDTSGVQDTTFPVEHLVFHDRTYPYDAFTALNAYHLWSLSVWEGRRLTFAPVDLTDYDWEIRLGDPGVEIDLQGDNADELFNGIAVSYTDVSTGRKLELTPDTHPELVDLSVENPANLEGLTRWTELDLSFPVTLEMALQLGRAALAEVNSPKSPGTIKVRGTIRDRAGHEQPAWKVRADDRVSITNFVNDRPRLIVETDYNAQDLSLSMSVDAPAHRLDAVFDRITSALGAAGLQ